LELIVEFKKQISFYKN